MAELPKQVRDFGPPPPFPSAAGRATFGSMNRSLAIAIVLALAVACSGCVSDDDLFSSGRIENLCNESIPACDVQAACVLDNETFYAGSFPGGQRVIVRSQTAHPHFVVRFLLQEMLFPGTEMLVEAYTPDCGAFDKEHPQDVDLFRRAGDDRILEYDLEPTGRGDHLVEIFSDMSADYQMTITVEE